MHPQSASAELYKYGSYRARIKVPDAPPSITGFFLYKEPDFEKEIDVEILNDSSGRIMFTTYAGGRKTNNVEKDLSFDPTMDFHEYRFDFYPDRAEFFVDGELMHRFTEGLPENPVRNRRRTATRKSSGFNARVHSHSTI